VGDGALDILGNVVQRDDEIGELEADAAVLVAHLDGQRGQLIKAMSPCSTARFSSTSRGMRTKWKSTLASAACCLATSFNSKAKSQPSRSMRLVVGAPARSQSPGDAPARFVSSPTVTGASTDPTWMNVPPRMPCSQT
jgi:ABC-type transporter Mla subunit MlaD